jgi:hypothetical protein
LGVPASNNTSIGPADGAYVTKRCLNYEKPLFDLIVFFSGAEYMVISVPGNERRLELLVSGLDFFVGTFVPFLIIFVSNFLIIISIRQASKERRLLRSGRGEEVKDTQYLTRMLLMVSAAYIVTSVPYRLYLFIKDMPGVASHYNLRDRYWGLRYTIELVLVFDIWCCNYAVNFYLYCLGGGKRYREDLKRLFKGKLC